jgi:hypothetical protein
VLSPGNTVPEMTRKFTFYRQYGVEEYYIYDPDRGELTGWLRHGDDLLEIPEMREWISPRLRIRFALDGADLVIHRPDGARFETFLELQQRAEAADERAELQTVRAERLATRLRELGIDPDM